MRTVVALALLGSTFVASPLHAVAPSDPIWVARYDGPGRFLDVANDSALSPDGSSLAATGLSDRRPHLFSADFATIVYDTASGDERWVARFNGSGHGWDNARAVIFSPNGARVFVTGGSRGVDSKQDFATVAYDAESGVELWSTRYDGPSHLGDTSVSLTVTPDGSRVLVSGRSVKSITGNRRVFATVAYDAETGEQLWVRRLNPSGKVNYLWSSVLTPDGDTLLVTGWGRDGVEGLTAETAAYDAISGEVLWAWRSDEIRAGYAATVDPDGATLFVTGAARGGFGTIAYDIATGDERWHQTFDAPGGYGDGFAVATGPDGTSLFVTGSAAWRLRGCSGLDYTTISYDAASGAERWVARYDGPSRGEDWAQAVATSPDGAEVYVTGESAGFGGAYSCVDGDGPRTGQDYTTVAYDASSGVEVWVRRYDSPGQAGYDSAHDLSVDGLGHIYVTGEGQSDYLTLSYDP
jgi:WD40 repeat protein